MALINELMFKKKKKKAKKVLCSQRGDGVCAHRDLIEDLNVYCLVISIIPVERRLV